MTRSLFLIPLTLFVTLVGACTQSASSEATTSTAEVPATLAAQEVTTTVLETETSQADATTTSVAEVAWVSEPTEQIEMHVNTAADDPLNLRTGPGVEYDVVAKLEHRSAVNLLGERSKVGSSWWTHIEAGSAKGWVNEGYLSLEPAAFDPCGVTSSTTATNHTGGVFSGALPTVWSPGADIVAVSREQLPDCERVRIELDAPITDVWGENELMPYNWVNLGNINTVDWDMMNESLPDLRFVRSASIDSNLTVYVDGFGDGATVVHASSDGKTILIDHSNTTGTPLTKGAAYGTAGEPVVAMVVDDSFQQSSNLRLSLAARAFEASIGWRVVDSSGSILNSGAISGTDWGDAHGLYDHEIDPAAYPAGSSVQYTAGLAADIPIWGPLIPVS